MKTLGLTGGIGMGKTAAADFLRQHGLAVVDTDALARQLVQPGQPALEEIARTFGSHYIDSTGRLRRADLAQRVFADPSQRRQLEAILHPRIQTLWHAQIGQWRQAGLPAAAVVIPLLFETNAQSEFDATLCVACSPTTQTERLRPRGWSTSEIAQRNLAQWPVERKMAHADFVLWNEAGLAVLADQVHRVLRRLVLA